MLTRTEAALIAREERKRHVGIDQHDHSATQVFAQQGWHGGSLDMFEMTLHPNARMPVGHYHESWDEIVYGLTGTTTWSIDGKDINVTPGESRLHQARHHPRFHKSHRPGGDVSLHSHSRYVGASQPPMEHNRGGKQPSRNWP